MSSVTFRIPAVLREYCGGAPDVTVSASTVGAALAQMELRHARLYPNVCDDTGRPRTHLNLFLNDVHLRAPDVLNVALKEGDVITILTAVSGG